MIEEMEGKKCKKEFTQKEIKIPFQANFSMLNLLCYSNLQKMSCNVSKLNTTIESQFTKSHLDYSTILGLQ